MMGLYPFFRLVFRPAMILGILLLIAQSTIVIAIDGAYRTGVGLQGEAARMHMWNMGAVVFPILMGFLAGQIVQEVRHAWFSWTLPRVKTGLLRGLVVSAAITAAITTVLYQDLGGTAPLGPIFAGALFWFVLGSTIESASFSFQFHRRSILTLLILLGAIPLIDKITDLYIRQPILMTSGLGILAGVFLMLEFSPASDRRKLSTPTLSLLNIMNTRSKERFKIDVGSNKSPSRRSWTQPLAQGGILAWIRAGEYENFGIQRGGWLLRLTLVTGGVVIIAGALGFQNGYEIEGSVTHGFQFAYYALFEDAGQTPVESGTPPHFVTYWMIGVMGWMFSFGLPIFSRSRLVPLSRRQRARVAYWSGVVQLSVITLLLGSFFYALGVVSLALSGEEGSLAHPTYIRVLLITAALTPLAQWLSLRFKGGCSIPRLKGLGMVAWVGGAIGTGVLASFWGLKGYTVFPGMVSEALAILAVLALSQWLWKRSVDHFYLRGDLA